MDRYTLGSLSTVLNAGQKKAGLLPKLKKRKEGDQREGQVLSEFQSPGLESALVSHGEYVGSSRCDERGIVLGGSSRRGVVSGHHSNWPDSDPRTLALVPTNGLSSFQ